MRRHGDRATIVKAILSRSENCPQCQAPDLVVIRLPIVRCLSCGCLYRLADPKPGNMPGPD